MITPGNKVKKLAEECIVIFNTNPNILTSRSIELVGKLAIIIKSVKFLKPASRDSMWHEVLLLMKDKAMLKSWEDFLRENSNFVQSTFSSMFHYVCMEIVRFIMKYENLKRESAPKEVIDIELTQDEQQVVYYVAGYVVFSLLRKYKKINLNNPANTAAIAAIQLLSSLEAKNYSKVQGYSFLQFAKKWLELVNRGGLIKVHDDMFIFIRQVENTMRTVLNIHLIKTYHGQDLREIIQEKLEQNQFINKVWETISRNVPNTDLSKILKKQIIAKWIDIRAQSFVSSYIQILKRKLSSMSKEEKQQANVNLSKVAEPALRKTLS